MTHLTEEAIVQAFRDAEAEITVSGHGWRSRFVVLPIRAGWMHYAIEVRGDDLEAVRSGLAVLRCLFMDGRKRHVRSDDGPEMVKDFELGTMTHGGYLRFSVEVSPESMVRK